MFPLNNKILELQNRLKEHSVYSSIETLSDLRCFVEHHIFSVWDFMSLVKFLQHSIAPASYPWFPRNTGQIRRFINEIVLEEESDETLINGEYLSHFEIYQNAMGEIGANTKNIKAFINSIKISGLNDALASASIPKPAKKFISTTFNFISSRKLHVIASAFTFGRETIIPDMFRQIIDKLGVRNEDCPTFYYYINRHIEVDDIKHGPIAMKLLYDVCEQNKLLYDEAIEAAEIALNARIEFWDGVLEALNNKDKLIQPSEMT